MKNDDNGPEGPSATPYGPRFYSIAEFAERCNIGRSLMFDMIRRGEVRTLKLGRRRVVPSSEIERLMSQAD